MTSDTVTSLPGIPAQPKRLVACGWCDSTHVADVTCTCREPCTRGWCPAVVDQDPFPIQSAKRYV